MYNKNYKFVLVLFETLFYSAANKKFGIFMVVSFYSDDFNIKERVA